MSAIPDPGQLPWISLVSIPVFPQTVRVMGNDTNVLPVGFIFIAQKVEGNFVCRLAGGVIDPDHGVFVADPLGSKRATPLQTAGKSVFKETGFHIPTERFRFIDSWISGTSLTYRRYLFRAHIYEQERDRISFSQREEGGPAPVFLSLPQLASTIEYGKFYERHRVLLYLSRQFEDSMFAKAA